MVTLGIASVFIFAMQQFTMLVEKNNAEESSLNITFYLRKFLSQAVELNAVTDINPAYLTGAGAGQGQIDVNFDLMIPSAAGIGTGDTGEFARFAVFNRESAMYSSNANGLIDSNGNPTGGSYLRPTAIFVKDTDSNGINPDAKSASLVIDYNSDGAAMTPTPNDLNFYRLHNIRVQRVDCNGVANGYAVEVVVMSTGTLLTCLPPGWAPTAGLDYRIKTITLETTVRYFKTATKGDWNYRAGDAGVVATAPYRDIVQTIKFNFKDNVLTKQSLTGAAGDEERVHGSLYFYDYVIPSTRE